MFQVPAEARQPTGDASVITSLESDIIPVPAVWDPQKVWPGLNLKPNGLPFLNLFCLSAAYPPKNSDDTYTKVKKQNRSEPHTVALTIVLMIL